MVTRRSAHAHTHACGVAPLSVVCCRVPDLFAARRAPGVPDRIASVLQDRKVKGHVYSLVLAHARACVYAVSLHCLFFFNQALPLILE